MTVDEIWVGRVDVAGLHSIVDLMRSGLRENAKWYLRYHIRDKFGCGVHGVLVEVHDHGVETFPQSRVPSERRLKSKY